MNKVIDFLVFSLILSIGFSVSAQEKPILENGQIVEREISGIYQKHVFNLKLSAGQFVRIEAEQNGCDVILALTNEEKLNVFDVNNSNSDGIETASAAVEKDGNYRLDIMSVSENKGIYKLKIGELRHATEKEIYLTKGITLLNDAFNNSNSSSTTVEITQNISKYKTAAEYFQLAEDQSFESRSFNEMGATYLKLGNLKKGIEYLEKALSISQSNNLKYEMLLNLGNLGAAYFMLGDTQKSFDFLLTSLKIAREIKNSRNELRILNKLGNFYNQIGDAARALEYFQQALQLVQNDSLLKNYKADTYENFGTAYLSQNEFQKARESFQKTLEISRETKSKRREASALSGLGKTSFLLGETEKSIEYLSESLNINRSLEDKIGESNVLKILGQIYFAENETDKALEIFNKLIELARSIENPQQLAENLLNSAKAEAKKGNLDVAQTKTEEAISSIEKIRSQMKTSDLRDSFSVKLQDFYSFQIELLMQRHKIQPNKNFAALAFQSSERARARGFLNLLAESNADIRQGVDRKLVEQETELKNLLSARLENLNKVLSGKSSPESVEKLKQEIEKFRAEFEQTQAQIRAASPHYATLIQPKILDLSEIQAQVLDAESILLEYHFGETKSFLWILGKNSFQTIELPSKSEIEKTAHQFYESLTARNKEVKFETDSEHNRRILHADLMTRELSAKLGQILLASAEKSLIGKRLLIVADGALQYIPFSALSVSPDKYLVETNEIVNLPSASALFLLRKETENRPLAPKTLAIFADPIFEAEDERFQLISNKKPHQKSEKNSFEKIVAKSPTRTLSSNKIREGFELSRLPFTRREAEFISALVPQNQQIKRLDFDASRSFVISNALTNYRYIHFATHGFINSETPELSGIVLSLFDENGRGQNGFLRVGDIYNLRLLSEMVVLSGCKTGLGKEIKGEGLVGLTRGFMYAGAKRVTVSLWDVNDQATSELMARFYREMLDENKLSPAKALRQAQISMLKNKEWNAPYFWATFILQGEPN